MAGFAAKAFGIKALITGRLPESTVFSVALGLIALLPRLFVAIAWAKEPVWDGHYYHFGAQRIAQGLGYSEDVMAGGHLAWKAWSHYPVGYSAFLAGVYKLFGDGLIVAPLANALISTLLAVFCYLVARYYISETRSRVAGALAALHPGLISYSALVMSELLAALLILSATWAALRLRGTWRAVLTAGALLGLAALVRPASLLLAPLLFMTQPRPRSLALLKAALATALATVVVLPWSLRNCYRMDGCAFVSTNGGWNLAIGALTKTGRFFTLRASDGCPVVTGQVQQDRCWADVALRAIKRDPTRWLALADDKLSQTYDHESFAIEYLHESDPESWPEARRTAARQLLTLFHQLLLIGAALSVISWAGHRKQTRTGYVVQGTLFIAVSLFSAHALARDNPPFYVLAALTPLIALLPLPGRPPQGPAGRYLLGTLAVTSLTHVVFFGDDRYHMVVTPALCILAAAALRPPTGRFGRPVSSADGFL